VRHGAPHLGARRSLRPRPFGRRHCQRAVLLEEAGKQPRVVAQHVVIFLLELVRHLRRGHSVIWVSTPLGSLPAGLSEAPGLRSRQPRCPGARGLHCQPLRGAVARAVTALPREEIDIQPLRERSSHLAHPVGGRRSWGGHFSARSQRTGGDGKRQAKARGVLASIQAKVQRRGMQCEAGGGVCVARGGTGEQLRGGCALHGGACCCTPHAWTWIVPRRGSFPKAFGHLQPLRLGQLAGAVHGVPGRQSTGLWGHSPAAIACQTLPKP
jgi:hypothetical protein